MLLTFAMYEVEDLSR